MTPKFGPELEVVISVLQTALTPAFLLVAVGSLLNVLTGRLSRIIDRSRDLHASMRKRTATHMSAWSASCASLKSGCASSARLSCLR